MWRRVLLVFGLLAGLSACVVLPRPVAVGLRAPAVVVRPVPRAVIVTPRCLWRHGHRHC